MAIVKTETEINSFLTVDASFDFNTVLPYIEIAEEDLIRILGQSLFDLLNSYYNETDPNPVTVLDSLLTFAQRPVVYFAFLKGLDMFNVNIGNLGIGVVHNTNLAPASEKRVENLRSSITERAYDSLEYLLKFLEDNVADYPLWEASDAYTYQYEYLINSARQFDELYKINRSRLTFLEYRPIMADVELLQIFPVVSKEFCDELKTQIKADTVSVANNVILPLLQKALAYFTASYFNTDVKLKTIADSYVMMAKTIIDTTPANYPTYAASSVYIADLANYQSYENLEDGKIGVFG